MQRPEPTRIVPPRTRIPQIPPQKIAENRWIHKVATPRPPFMQEATRWAPVREDTAIPVTPCSIPGYFVNDEAKRSEPGFGETLVGCGMLLLMGVIVVVVLYYLMV